MPAQYAVPEIPYTLDQVRLGSLVLDRAYPHQDAFGPERDLKEAEDYSIRRAENFTLEWVRDRDRAAGAHLLHMFSGLGGSRRNGEHRVVARQTGIHELSEPRKLFEEVSRSPEARDWLTRREKAGDDVHFVVGFITALNATEVVQEYTKRNREAFVGAPHTAAQSPTHATGVNASAVHQAVDGRTHSAIFPGERILAVRHLRVVFKWHARTDLGQAALRGGHWVVVGTRRGVENVPWEVSVELDEEDIPESEMSLLVDDDAGGTPNEEPGNADEEQGAQPC
jgi:hypothetical protein